MQYVAYSVHDIDVPLEIGAAHGCPPLRRALVQGRSPTQALPHGSIARGDRALVDLAAAAALQVGTARTVDVMRAEVVASGQAEQVLHHVPPSVRTGIARPWAVDQGEAIARREAAGGVPSSTGRE